MGFAGVVKEVEGRHIKRLVLIERVLLCKAKLVHLLEFRLIIDVSFVLINNLRRACK